MGRHSDPTQAELPSTGIGPDAANEALALLVWDMSKLISKNDGYDGLIDQDKLDPDALFKLLPEMFRAAGFDPFGPKVLAEPVYADDPDFVRHTCNPNRPGMPLPFGRKAPAGKCRRCDQLRAGAPPREAPPAIQAAKRRREDDERAVLEINDHFASARHRNGGCRPVCTFGDA